MVSPSVMLNFNSKVAVGPAGTVAAAWKFLSCIPEMITIAVPVELSVSNLSSASESNACPFISSVNDQLLKLITTGFPSCCASLRM